MKMTISGDSDVSDDELEGPFANPLGVAVVAGGAVGTASVVHSAMGGVGIRHGRSFRGWLTLTDAMHVAKPLDAIV
jgi:hypothetical protein|eukprot:COSAG02_NODE_4583_length_5190_cov_4.804753_2_plen_76_part_00